MIFQRQNLSVLTALITLSLLLLMRPTSSGAEDATRHGGEPPIETARVVTFNVLGLRGFPLEKGSPIVFPDPAPDLVRALASRVKDWQVDVLVLQEAPPESVVRELAALCGMNYVFFPTRSNPSEDWPFGFPGAVLSRWPVSDAVGWAGAALEVGHELFQRHWGEVTVMVNDHPLRIAGLHLCADWGGVFRESTRMAELELFLGNNRADMLAGDFNMRPESAPWLLLTQNGWRDLWPEAGDKTGGLTSDSRELKARIDYLWLAPDAPWKPRKARVLENVRVTIGQDVVYLSDHLPVLAELEYRPPGS